MKRFRFRFVSPTYKKVPVAPPNCNKCKYFNNGYCTLFLDQLPSFEKQKKIVYVPALICRKTICGPEGTYFKPK
jgi:hypothetical protein